MIAGETVPAWQPGVTVADAVTERDRAAAFAATIASAYDSPPIALAEPQGLIVTGGRWVVVGERDGLVRNTAFLIPRFTWIDAFRDLALPNTPMRHWLEPTLIAGTRYPDNHFHWVFQGLGTIIAAHALGLPRSTVVALPPLDDRRRASLALFGIDNPLEILPDPMLAIATRGIVSTTCGGDHGMTPHPAMLAMLRDEARRIAGPRRRVRKLFLSRCDVGARRLTVNEGEVADALAARGFEVVAPGELTLAAQMTLFREAAVIVAPHGAALANLAWLEDGADGPAVIELLQENYTNRCFARLCQAKRLAYHALICECAVRADLLVDTRGRTDLPRLLEIVGRLDWRM